MERRFSLMTLFSAASQPHGRRWASSGSYILFLAFQQSVRLGTLVAGFGIGIVFFIITIVPQGAGAVLGMMTLVFSSMGIPKTIAFVIALAFRGMNFWLPLFCGFFLICRNLAGPTNQS